MSSSIGGFLSFDKIFLHKGNVNNQLHVHVDDHLLHSARERERMYIWVLHVFNTQGYYTALYMDGH